MSSGPEDEDNDKSTDTLASSLGHVDLHMTLTPKLHRHLTPGMCQHLAVSTDNLRPPCVTGNIIKTSPHILRRAGEGHQMMSLSLPRPPSSLSSPRSPKSSKSRVPSSMFQFQQSGSKSGKGACEDRDMAAEQRASHSRQGSQRQIRVGKTTTVLFAVTLAYILSFLPYLIVMVMRSIIKDLESSLSPLGELAYKFCVKSFFINNAINPLIYSFLNQAFRKDAGILFRRLCGKSMRPTPRLR